MNRYEAIFGLGLATALVLDACGPKPTTAIEKPQSGDGGGQAGEVESIPNLISDIRAEKIDLSQPEMDAFNTKLQNPETHVVKYVAQGDGYIVTEIDPEVRHDAVCLEQERWGVEGSSAVDLCSTLIEGQELILTNNDRDELVALMPFTVASGIEGYAGLAQDGKTIVPILARGSDGEIYVYNQDTLQYHPLGGETQILDILDIDELFLKNGGGTVVDSRSRGVGHVTRLRFKNGIEVIETPEGVFVSPEYIALQDRIAASGETFTLLSDGTIEQTNSEGAVIVPGLAVDKNGVMTLLQGDSSQVMISPEDVSFDDEKGVNVAGYTLDEATGLWGVAQEIVYNARGVGFELGDQIVGQSDGVREIVDFIPPVGLDSKEKIAFEDKFDDTILGFGEDDNQWVYIPIADGKYRVVLQNIADQTNEIAELGSSEVVWDWSKMMDENGESLLLKVGKLWEMSGGYPVQFDQATTSSNQLVKSLMTDGFFEGLTKTGGQFYWTQVISRDASQGVVINFYVPGQKEAGSKGSASGYVTFFGTDDRDRPKARWIRVKNFDEDFK